MAKAIRYHKQGGPEVLQLDDIPVGEPGQGQVRIKHTAIGVNFVDTYQRSGLYPVSLPSGIGLEAAGKVEAVGEGVTAFQKEDRVAYCTGPRTEPTIQADTATGSVRSRIHRCTCSGTVGVRCS